METSIQSKEPGVHSKCVWKSLDGFNKGNDII